MSVLHLRLMVCDFLSPNIYEKELKIPVSAKLGVISEHKETFWQQYPLFSCNHFLCPSESWPWRWSPPRCWPLSSLPSVCGLRLANPAAVSSCLPVHWGHAHHSPWPPLLLPLWNIPLQQVRGSVLNWWAYVMGCSLVWKWCSEPWSLGS